MVVGADCDLGVPEAEGRTREHGSGGDSCESEDGGEKLHNGGGNFGRVERLIMIRDRMSEDDALLRVNICKISTVRPMTSAENSRICTTLVIMESSTRDGYNGSSAIFAHKGEVHPRRSTLLEPHYGNRPNKPRAKPPTTSTARLLKCLAKDSIENTPSFQYCTKALTCCPHHACCSGQSVIVWQIVFIETDSWLWPALTGKGSGDVNLRANGRDGVAPLAWIKLLCREY